MAVEPIASGIERTFQGLRTGDQRSVLTGALLVAYGIWRRGRRDKRKLIHRAIVEPGHALIVRANTVGGSRIIVGKDLAHQLNAGRRRRSRTNA
jgi:hypothetical protein